MNAFTRPELVGRTIVRIERMPADHMSGRPSMVAVVLDDDTYLWPSTDDENEMWTYTPSILASRDGADWALETDYPEVRDGA